MAPKYEKILRMFGCGCGCMHKKRSGEKVCDGDKWQQPVKVYKMRRRDVRF